jgi:hypothetical protein
MQYEFLHTLKNMLILVLIQLAIGFANRQPIDRRGRPRVVLYAPYQVLIAQANWIASRGSYCRALCSIGVVDGILNVGCFAPRPASALSESLEECRL